MNGTKKHLIRFIQTLSLIPQKTIFGARTRGRKGLRKTKEGTDKKKEFRKHRSPRADLDNEDDLASTPQENPVSVHHTPA